MSVAQKSLSDFSVSELLDTLYELRIFAGDSEEWKAKVAASKAVIIAELESRPAKELVRALVAEAIDR